MQVKWNFNGRRALVSGGSKGIGAGIVQLLAASGADVVFTYGSDAQAAEQTVHACASMAGKVTPVKCNHEAADELKQLVSRMQQDGQELHYLVNNVGITRDSPLYKMDDNQWTEVMQTNLTSMFRLTRGVYRMLALGKGSIVNIASVAGMTGQGGQTNYAASKAGIIGFTKSLAKESAGIGVRVNAVAPGYIDTAMVREMHQEKRRQAEGGSLLRRLGEASEVAAATAFLLSDAASYITGQVLVVDGGITLLP